MADINPGDQVLVRGSVTADGRMIVLAPGVELPLRAVDVIAPMPEETDGMPLGLVFFFENDEDRQDFARSFVVPSVGVDL